jgi:hypothetical protein
MFSFLIHPFITKNSFLPFVKWEFFNKKIMKNFCVVSFFPAAVAFRAFFNIKEN